MPKGQYERCKVVEFDMMMSCNRKAVGTSCLHEPYFRDIHYVPLCTSHLAWINRPESDYDVDYPEWQVLNA